MNAPARSSDRIRELERQLHWAQLKIQVLEEELRQRRIQQLGPKSETLSNLQLALLTEEEPSTTRDEVEAEARRETLTRAHSRETRPHSGRKPLESLPRVTSVVVCQETACAACGEQTAVIGFDESELEAAMRSIASRERLRLLTLISNISRLQNPKNWAMVVASNGYRAIQVRLQLMPELTLSLRETAGSRRSISFSTSYSVQRSELIPRRWARHLIYRGIKGGRRQ